MRFATFLVGLLSLGLVPAIFCEDSTVCSDMVREAAHNVGVSTSSYDYQQSLYDNYCRQDKHDRSSDTSLSLGGDLIPLDFGQKESASSMTNFCKTHISDSRL